MCVCVRACSSNSSEDTTFATFCFNGFKLHLGLGRKTDVLTDEADGKLLSGTLAEDNQFVSGREEAESNDS